MRFLVDAQLPIRLTHFLSNRGHNARHVTTLPDGVMTTDAVIASVADAEGRVVVSTAAATSDVLRTDQGLDHAQGQELNADCVFSRPTVTSDSTASAARSTSTASSFFSAAEKFESRKSAGSCRPGGRPTPTRTRK